MLALLRQRLAKALSPRGGASGARRVVHIRKAVVAALLVCLFTSLVIFSPRIGTAVGSVPVDLLPQPPQPLPPQQQQQQQQVNTTHAEPEQRTLANTFDHVYVTGVKGCEHRSQLISGYAEQAGLNPRVFFGVHFKDIDLDNPPIPVRDIPQDADVKTGQVACTATHNMVWEDVIKNNYSNVMVLEDDVFFTDEILEYLPQLMEEINAAGRQKGIDWHYLYFRRAPLQRTDTEKVWSDSPSGHPVTYACPSWGTASYAMSNAGARFLHENARYYQYPLDVQISKLQQSRKDFVALSACHNNDFKYLCPENIFEISREQKKHCSFSGTQAGDRRSADHFPRTRT